MRKNDLIKHLQNIKGNPEILLWNGLVGDWQHISPKIIESDLVKQTLEDFIKRCSHEEKRNRNDWDYELSEQELEEVKSDYKKFAKWETNDYVTIEDVKNGYYKRKVVYYLQPVVKGETYHDRLGNINY